MTYGKLVKNSRMKQHWQNLLSQSFQIQKKSYKAAIATRKLPSEWWSLDEDEKAERVDQEDLNPDLLDSLVEASDIAESNLRYNIACKENAYEETYIKLRDGLSKNWKKNRCSDNVDDKASERLLARKLPIELRSLDENELVEKIKSNDVDSNIYKSAENLVQPGYAMRQLRTPIHPRKQ